MKIYFKYLLLHQFSRPLFICLRSFLFFLIAGCALSLSAQTPIDSISVDSLEEDLYLDASGARVEYFMNDHIGIYQPVDTSLDGFQKFNPVRKQLFDDAYLGNLGAPYYARLYSFNRYLGFDYGRHERDLYLTDISELKYYRTNIPFTDLNYVIGSNSEQYFSVLHTRNIGPDLNFSIGLDKIASVGYYQHMNNSTINVTSTIWYKTKNGFYEMYAGGIHSGMKNEENGGINNDTLFSIPFPNLAEPYRAYAFTEWKNWQGQIMQQINLGRHVIYEVNDTTTGRYFAPEFYVRHIFGVHDYDYAFEDLYDTIFYNSLFDDSDTLRDLSDVDGFYNRISIGNAPLRYITRDSAAVHSLRWELYGLQQYHEISDGSGEIIKRNLIAGFSIAVSDLADSLLMLHADGAYDVIENSYETIASARLTKFLIQPEIGFRAGSYSPLQIQEYYYGFKFRWETNFNGIGYRELFGAIHLPAIQTDLKASLSTITNAVYFDQFFPVQAEKDITVLQVIITKNFTLGNFHLNNSVAYQSVSSIFNYPKYLADISWYFEKHLFHSALYTQIGFDAWYSDAYAGHSYNMITGQFNELPFFPGTDSLHFDPVIDVFANFDIRTFRFFLKVDNVAQGLFSKGYYETPNYPMQPRGVKLGVNWMLFY